MAMRSMAMVTVAVGAPARGVLQAMLALPGARGLHSSTFQLILSRL